MRNALIKATVAASMLLALGCGKRGDPKPPVPVIPQATSDLVVTQRADKVILAWSYPALTTAGRSLGKVDRVRVFRYVEPLPVDAKGPADPLPDSSADPARPAAASSFASIPTLSANQFLRLRELVDTIEGTKLPNATSGTKLIFEDTPPMQSIDKRPVRLTYSVVTEGGTSASDLSNLVTIVPLVVPAPPATVTAEAGAPGVTLRWNTPATSVAGFNIYRTPTGELPDEFATPVNPAPITGNSFTDTPPFGTWDYRVTAVAAAGPPRVESGLSVVANAIFRDLVPPPPPATVTALLETKIVRLIWDPVDAPDLNGYNVYRTEGKARLKLTPNPARQTFFGDESIDIGIAYFYSITSVDKSGNESAPVNSGTVLVPKTP